MKVLTKLSVTALVAVTAVSAAPRYSAAQVIALR